MESLLDNLPLAIFLGLAAFAQWITQVREARRREEQKRKRDPGAITRTQPTQTSAAHPEGPAAARRRRRVVVMDGPDGPVPTLVSDEDDERSGDQPRDLRDRHLPHNHSPLAERRIHSDEPRRVALRATPSVHDALAQAPGGGPSIVPRNKAQLRNALLHVEVLGPPAALRKRRRRHR